MTNYAGILMKHNFELIQSICSWAAEKKILWFITLLNESAGNAVKAAAQLNDNCTILTKGDGKTKMMP